MVVNPRGTPNSGTTSLSALSTTAIKDGHQGQPLPHSNHHHHAHRSSSTSMSSTNTLEAERADRISRLAGLERVATARAASGNQAPPGSALPAAHALTSGYFDTAQSQRERSTVGSASATGSVGGRTTWASGSDAFEADSKMSEDTMDDGTSSVGNISDEGNASLVGFGEGASTISGPISRPNLHRVSSGGRTPSSLSSPSLNRGNPLAAHLQNTTSSASDGPMIPSPSPLSPVGSSSNVPDQLQPGMSIEDARMLDGMTYDPDVVDTTVCTPRLATPFYRSTSHHGSGSTGSSEPGSGR